jgi:hypothetical protein
MKAFKCGEKVPISGIYRVLHLLSHNADQRELYFEGSRFPICTVCAARVHYRLESPYVPMAAPAVVELARAVC